MIRGCARLIWATEMMAHRLVSVVSLLAALTVSLPAGSQPRVNPPVSAAPAAGSGAASSAGADAVVIELPAQFQRGPLAIALGTEATLDLPTDFSFLPAMETRALLREWGNRPSDRTLGMIIPTREGSPPPWFMVITRVPEGHVEAIDTPDWDHDALLAAIRQGLAGNNAARREAGAAQTEVLGWARPPRFDPAAQRLTWALSIRDKPAPGATAAGGDPDDEPDEDPDAELIANDNTILLGRRGYLSASVVLPIVDYVRHAGEIATLVAAIGFRPGERYTDFQAVSDRRSPRTLADLLVAEPAPRAGWLDRLLTWRVEAAYVLGAVLMGGLMGVVSRLRNRSASRRPTRSGRD